MLEEGGRPSLQQMQKQNKAVPDKHGVLSTPKLPRWDSLVLEDQKVEGRASEPLDLRLSTLQGKNKMHSEETGAQLAGGWH